MKQVLAWHFTNGWRLRDRQKLVVGKTYTHTGDVKICSSGLHASIRLLDALKYAPLRSGLVISRVECSDIRDLHSDKFVCATRRVIASAECDTTLHFLAADIAEAALMIADVTDGRPWDAIQAKREWANGELSDKELEAAEKAWAAWDVAAGARTARTAAVEAAAWAARATWAAGGAWVAAMDEINAVFEDTFKKLLGERAVGKTCIA